MSFTLVKFLVFILGHIPGALVAPLGRGIGRLYYALDRSHRQRAMENMILAGYGEAHARALTREVFGNLGITFLEVMRLPWLRSASDLEGLVRCEGLDVFEKALGRGRGVMLITGHLGNWELMATWYALKGFSMDVVVRDLDSPLGARLMDWMRTRHGNAMVLKKRSMRRLLKTLAGGGIAGLLIDQNVARVEGVFVDFFGVPACTNKGPAMLAATSGAAVIPTFISREKGGHVIRIGPEIEVVNTGDRKKDALTNTARFTRAVEEAIRRTPAEWFWVHRRWKTRPD